MNKLLEYLKKLRGEFRVVLIIVFILLIYTLYSLIFKDDDTSFKSYNKESYSTQSNGTSSYDNNSQIDNDKSDNNSEDKPSTISEAISKDRPIVLSLDSMKDTIDNMTPLDGSVKSIEMATEVENPTIWIYALNDGSRKDDLAEKYCIWLHENGVMASSVTIMDELAKNKGKLIEIGESKCIK